MKRLALVGLVAALGCSRKEPVAGVVVRIESDMRIPEQLDSVELRVDVGGVANVVKLAFPLEPGAAGAKELPLYYGLYPKQGKGGQFTVTAVGSVKGTEVVWRSASLAFPTAGPTVLLQLALQASCTGIPCTETTTCIAANCRPREVVEQLPPYRRGGGDPIVGGEPDGGGGPAHDTAVPPPVEAGTDLARPTDLGSDGPADDASGDLRPASPDLSPDTAPPDTGPTCTPQPESCFNGLDEDCDNLIDCADPDCAPGAQCVTLDATDNGMPGIVSAATTCPAGFNQAAPIVIRSGPTGAACTGCACGPAAAACNTATVVSYNSPADCQADISHPTTPPSFTRAEGCKVPEYASGFMGGLKVMPMTPILSACAPSGTPAPGAVTWASTTRFCATTLRGAGCGQGRVCVPRPPQGGTPPPACVLYTGNHACGTGMTKYQNLDWFTGASDGRSCSACTCAAPAGGSCAGVTIHIGNDYTCNPNNGDIAPGVKMCYASNIYVPGLQINGTGTAGTCAPRTTTTGAITPTGPRTVCCL